MKKIFNIIFISAFVFLISISFSQEKIVENSKAINFSLPDLNGKKYTLSDFKGNVILLNFWATWCPPCRYEIPILEKIYNKYKNKGFKVIAVSLDSDSNSLSNFLKSNKVSFLVLSDKKGELGYKYQVVAIPTSFLIDKEFIVRKIYMGAISEKDFTKELEKWLKE
ncbi:MAG TPA: TlpA disulfide reductase family protein [Dictyoglomaceae bacterium]|nr:TlpA disulfide reductase family protein [Dictyoglomaceae bacterium]HOL39821.1 TlpA disulfide reductase family protein [Dictyoglomaceae bacterium]HPP16237.1 TlpA disulfide reductase family protein [Dictyoglomaceae bacterium]HPU44153.1 TlpA disulfide reductase family protein [Dictyoglomaceae bacterium]